MTAAKIEETLVELEQCTKNYHKAGELDSKVYWLKEIRVRAMKIVALVDDLL